jgi:hypothetical protein
MQCPICWSEFKNRQQKYNHLKSKYPCTPRPKPATRPQIAGRDINNAGRDIYNIGGDLNINIGSLNIIVSPPSVADFSNTNTKKVTDEIIRNPALYQVVATSGKYNLYQLIISQLYYTGALENRNVYGIENKGVCMYVHENGVRTAIDRDVGLKMSVSHVDQVLAHPKVQIIMAKNDDTKAAVAPSDRCYELYRMHRMSHLNKGFVTPVEYVLPDRQPDIASTDSLIDTIMATMPADINRTTQSHVTPAIHAFMKRFEYVGGRWFIPTEYLDGYHTVAQYEHHLLHHAYGHKSNASMRVIDAFEPRDFSQEYAATVGWEYVQDKRRIRANLQYFFQMLLWREQDRLKAAGQRAIEGRPEYRELLYLMKVECTLADEVNAAMASFYASRASPR